MAALKSAGGSSGGQFSGNCAGIAGARFSPVSDAGDKGRERSSLICDKHHLSETRIGGGGKR